MPIDTETDVETTDTDKAPSLRDSLAAKFDELSAEPGGAELEQSAVEPLEGETQEQAEQRARDEAGRFTKEPKKAPVKTAPKAAVKPTLTKPGAKPPDAVKPTAGGKPVPTSAQPGEMKAPQAWREPAKAAWAALPDAAKVEVLRREKEITSQIAGLGEERKYAQTMRQAFAPFEAQIRAEGSTPDQAIGKLMGTAMLLRTGPAHMKAAAVAEMIGTYGVDIRQLVAALEGKGPPAGQPQQHQQLDPAALVQQVREGLMKDLGSQREQALAAKVQGELDTFLQDKAMHGLDGSDYGEEIKETMADLIELALKRKSTITLERAYILAAQQHPEVSKVLARQEQAAKAVKANASTQRARVAASSVRNSPSTEPVGDGKSKDLRSALDKAFEQHS